MTDGQRRLDLRKHPTLGFYTEKNGKVEFLSDAVSIEDFEEGANEIASFIEVIGNIYENKKLLEEKE